MNSDFLVRGIVAAVFGLAFAWAVFSRYDGEVGSEELEGKKSRYQPVIYGGLLPLYLAILSAAELLFFGPEAALRELFSLSFGVFLHISLYYVLLLPLLPWLRRRISARACAMLWMIPNYLYITSQSFMAAPRPLLVIRASGDWVFVLLGVWAAGFAAVFFHLIFSHLRFRRQVLRCASPVTDPRQTGLFRQELEAAGIQKTKARLVISPTVTTPLTIGLFRWTMRVVLPERAYSEEELRLIFRHEAVHMGRQDSWAKFFLGFCTAMCWFNPLMWIAMRKSAEDVELSCDETVLLKADGETKRRYAELLLKTAGDERGFTTCLSASSRALRYRLRAVIGPGRRRSGALTVGAAFFLLCLTCGFTALSYGGESGAARLFLGEVPSDYTLRSVQDADGEFQTEYAVLDEAAFKDYLSSLEMSELTGNFTFSEDGRKIIYIFDTPTGALGVNLSDHYLKRVPISDEDATGYYLPEGVDWAAVDRWIVPCPALNVQIFEEGDRYGHKLSASLERLTAAGETLYEAPPGTYNGAYGYDAREAVFTFSQEPLGPCTVEIESWDRSKKETLTLDDWQNPFPLPAEPAHYRILAVFSGTDGQVYEAIFRFELGGIDG